MIIDPHTRIRELEARVADLEQQLADALAIPDLPIWRDVFGLQPMGAKMLQALMTVDGMASRIWLEDTLWPGVVPGKAPEVHMSKIRTALRAHGFPHAIETIWGYGWKIQPDQRAAIREYAERKQQGRAR